MKVMVADDDLVARAILDRILRKPGYDPVLTESGRTALAAITREEIHLLVTGWNMPAPTAVVAEKVIGRSD